MSRIISCDPGVTYFYRLLNTHGVSEKLVIIMAHMKTSRVALAVLLFIIAMNAFGGGYYALAGAKDVPLEWLKGSPFKNYFLPGLFLFIAIGGTSLTASIMVFTNSRYAIPFTLFCGWLLIGWISIQVAIIGYVSWMQPAIFISGIVILILANILRKNQITPNDANSR